MLLLCLITQIIIKNHHVLFFLQQSDHKNKVSFLDNDKNETNEKN